MPLNRRETFSFPAEEYPDLAAWLDKQPQGQRSQAIAEALTLHVRRQVPAPAQVMAELGIIRSIAARILAHVAPEEAPQ